MQSCYFYNEFLSLIKIFLKLTALFKAAKTYDLFFSFQGFSATDFHCISDTNTTRDVSKRLDSDAFGCKQVRLFLMLIKDMGSTRISWHK